LIRSEAVNTLEVDGKISARRGKGAKWGEILRFRKSISIDNDKEREGSKKSLYDSGKRKILVNTIKKKNVGKNEREKKGEGRRMKASIL